MNFTASDYHDTAPERLKHSRNITFDTELNQILVAVASMDEQSADDCDGILSVFNEQEQKLIENTRNNIGIASIKKMIIDIMFANPKYSEFYLKQAQENGVISSLFCERAWYDIHKSSPNFSNVSREHLCVFAAGFMLEQARAQIKKKYFRLQNKALPLEHYHEQCERLLSDTLRLLGMVSSRSVEMQSTKKIIAMREVLSQVLSDNFMVHNQSNTNKEKIIDNILSLYYKKYALQYNLPTVSLLQFISTAVAESVFSVKKCNVNYIIAKGIIEPYYKSHFDQKTITEYLIEYMFTYTKKQIKKNKGEQCITLYEAPLVNFLCSNSISENMKNITRLVSKLVYETLKILKKNQILGSYEENMAICDAFYDIARKDYGLALPSLDDLQNKAKKIIKSVNHRIEN
ncbi:hypothetical protein [Candidatus Regiella insecticola]|nr:hypothetical protein [Candidatus Regiella insecticola]GFN45529.1 hypothetical protein RINTU1_07360 [Candidatus Regiella insecticola]